MISKAKTYPYAEQPGPIAKYPQSIYCFDFYVDVAVDVDFGVYFDVDVDVYFDVNNSNTFIRWLFDRMSFDREIKDG